MDYPRYSLEYYGREQIPWVIMEFMVTLGDGVMSREHSRYTHFDLALKSLSELSEGLPITLATSPLSARGAFSRI
jgi:hypothetical protein